MIEAITFDCWDTLIADDPSRNNQRKEHFIKVFNECGIKIDDDKINQLFSEEARLFMEHIIENIKTQESRERVDTIINLAGVEIPGPGKEKLADYCDKIALEFPPPVVPGVQEVLEVLSKEYNLAVICNTGWHSAATVRSLLESYGFPKYFSHLTFSDESGIAKPHKQIFEYTLKKLNISTRLAVHIGDSEYSDIVGAREAGMKAILFTGINDKYKNNNTADIEISNYDNLVEIIKEM